MTKLAPGQKLYEFYRTQTTDNTLLPWGKVANQQERDFWATMQDSVDGKTTEAMAAEREAIVDFIRRKVKAFETADGAYPLSLMCQLLAQEIENKEHL